MSMDHTIVDVIVKEVERRQYPSKHYVYVVDVTWSNGAQNIIYRRYSKFFQLQVDLLEQFPVEGGDRDPAQRIIPFLPGKILFGRSHIERVALKRMSQIDSYCQSLIKLPTAISTCQLINDFFTPTAEDLAPRAILRTSAVKKTEISEPISLEVYRAIAAYKKIAKNETDLKAGELIEVSEKNEKGWWFVTSEEGQGWVPSTYLQLPDGTQENHSVNNSTEDAMKYLCTKNYEPKFSDEIALDYGAAVTVLNKNLNGWWLVSYKGREGLAPAVYLNRVSTLKASHHNARKINSASIITSTNNHTKQTRNTGSQHLPTNQAASVSLQLPASSLQSSPLPVKHGPPPRSQSIEISEYANVEEEEVYVAIADFIPLGGVGLKLGNEEQLEVIEKSATGWWFVKTPCGDVGWAPAPYITKKSVVVPHKKENKVIFSDIYSNMAGSKERVTLHTDPAKQNKNTGSQHLPTNQAASVSLQLPASSLQSSPLPVKHGPPPRRQSIEISEYANDEEEEVYVAIADFIPLGGVGLKLGNEEQLEVIEKSATDWWFVKTPCGDVGWAPAPYITKKSVVVPHKKENKVIFSDIYSNMAGSKERVTLHTDPAKQNKKAARPPPPALSRQKAEDTVINTQSVLKPVATKMSNNKDTSTKISQIKPKNPSNPVSVHKGDVFDSARAIKARQHLHTVSGQKSGFKLLTDTKQLENDNEDYQDIDEIEMMSNADLLRLRNNTVCKADKITSGGSRNPHTQTSGDLDADSVDSVQTTKHSFAGVIDKHSATNSFLHSSPDSNKPDIPFKPIIPSKPQIPSKPRMKHKFQQS